MSISGNTITQEIIPTQTESLEIFMESDDTNPLHVNYDFTKSEPLTIITDEEIIEKKKKYQPIRHYKLKKDDTSSKSRYS